MSPSLLAFYLSLMMVFLVGLMIVQHLQGTHGIISLRNFYLAGLVVYLIISPIYVLWAEDPSPFRVMDLASSGLTYCIYLTIYIVVFLWAYSRRQPMLRLAQKVPAVKVVPSDGAMLAMAIVLSLLALPCRFLMVLPMVGVVAYYVALALTSVSSGLLGWVLARRWINPAVWMIFFPLMALNGFIAVFEQMTRRPLLSVLLAVLWGLYFSRMRYQRPAQSLALLMAVVLPLVILLAVYTSVRTQEFREMGSLQIIREMSNPANIDLKSGVKEMFGGQATGGGALWTMEAYPDLYDRRPMMSLAYLIVGNIPRTLWPDKPYVYSAMIADQAKIQGANLRRTSGEKGVTLPPGVIAFAEAEGGLIAVVVYAVFFAFSIRFLENLALLHAHIPFVVLAVGSALGTLTGLARGDIALFYMLIIWSFVSAYVILLLFGLMVRRTTAARYIDGRLLPGTPAQAHSPG